MKNKIIEFLDYKPHLSGEAICTVCQNKWIAVVSREILQKDHGFLKCPKCKAYKGVYRYPLDKKGIEYLWACDCGSKIFYLSPESFYCGVCGDTFDYKSL